MMLKQLTKEEIAEEKEIESRKLNVMCFNIPESKRQNEDTEFLINLLDTKLNYSLGEEDIINVFSRWCHLWVVHNALTMISDYQMYI